MRLIAVCCADGKKRQVLTKALQECDSSPLLWLAQGEVRYLFRLLS